MAQKLRLQYPGATYHVMNRGDRREAVFLDDLDRHGFLGLKESGMERARLKLLPGNSTAKLGLARRLHRETTMSLKWIAQQLGTGTWKHLSNLLANEPAGPDQAELRL